LPLFIKGPKSRAGGFLPLAFGLKGFLGLGFLGIWLDSFALGFLVWEAFGREKNY
jgi:hypothetical protein